MIEGMQLVDGVVGDLVQQHHIGEVRAISVAWIDADGDAHSLSAWSHGTKLQLVGAVSIQQRDLLAHMAHIVKEQG